MPLATIVRPRADSLRLSWQMTIPGKFADKQEEIDLYRSFVSRLPANSYLSDLLADSPEIVERAIRNDLAIPTLSQCLAARRDDAAELVAVRDQIKQSREELATITRQLARAQGEMAEIRTTARKLAQL